MANRTDKEAHTIHGTNPQVRWSTLDDRIRSISATISAEPRRVYRASKDLRDRVLEGELLRTDGRIADRKGSRPEGRGGYLRGSECADKLPLPDLEDAAGPHGVAWDPCMCHLRPGSHRVCEGIVQLLYMRSMHG